ncbi:MAG TPA: heparan-alpha-glucosaminide N-acetyltransferase [Candidatus Peribacteraceae bacterium]|nr:heparan-alpha-glucosaminide N-acetyltransferase [Candidatus Peribacteraceae bacterium]
MRYSELDLLRTAAVLGMIVYHGGFDLQSYYGFDLDVLHGGWMVLERIVANLFLLLVGISFAISYDRTPAEKRWPKYLKRGLFVIGCGCLVSIVTYIVDAQTFVRFGVLHMIGVSILLLPLFVRLRLWNLLIAIALIIAGPFVAEQTLPTGLLLPLGFMPPDFATVDYFPLIPWFGTILIGLVIGQTFYIRKLQWRNQLPSLITRHLPLATLPGRHALIIYLLHQPVLIGILLLTLGPWNV